MHLINMTVKTFKYVRHISIRNWGKLSSICQKHDWFLGVPIAFHDLSQSFNLRVMKIDLDFSSCLRE